MSGGPLELPGDPDTIVKTNNGTNTPGGGGPPAPPPAGFGGFGGVDFFPGEPGGLGFGMGIKRRLGMNPVMQMAGGGYDSIPAMLSPGEFVVNAGAAQHPAVAQLLMLINQLGGVSPYADPMTGQFAQPQAFHPQAMAGGGYAGGSNGWGGSTQQMQGYSGQFSGGNGGGYASFGHRQPGVGANAPSFGGTTYQAPATTTPTGTTTSGSANPASNPASGFDWGFGGTTNGYQRMIYDMLNQYGANGAFSPGGSQTMMNALSANAKQQADALTQRSMLGADVYGMDPSQAGATRLQALMGTNKDAADTMTGAYAGLLNNQQNLAQNLLGSMLGYNNETELSNGAYLHNQLLGNQNQGGSINWGSILGTGLGAFAGGLGGSLGKKV